VRKVCYEEGVIILGCGVQSLRFRSPLSTTKEEIDKGLAILRRAIEQVRAEAPAQDSAG
jgi:L-lysine 6-transaminase